MNKLKSMKPIIFQFMQDNFNEIVKEIDRIIKKYF